MKAELAKLQLQPADIVVATLPAKSGSARKAQQVYDHLRKILPPGQRVLVKFSSLKLEKLVDLITPEDLHRLNELMEQKLLAAPGVELPIQTKVTASRP